MSSLIEGKNESKSTENNKSPGGNAGKIIGIVSFGVLFLAVLQILLDVPITTWLKDLFFLKHLPKLGDGAGLGLLFLFGLLTSFHCVGMCGGIAISQTVGKHRAGLEQDKKKAVFFPSALYNTGRIIAYTFVGAVVGGLGQVIGFSGIWKGVVPILGGVFMIIMAINLLDIFPVLRRFVPRLPTFVVKKLYGKHDYGPFVVGILTGLMPCGPLQMVQLYALGTKSVFQGAVSMLVFALGTVPLMFFFGVINTYLNKRFSKIILRASAALVLVLGIVMIGRGLALAGVHTPLAQLGHLQGNQKENSAVIENGVQRVTAAAGQDSFPAIIVQKGIPVEFRLTVAQQDLNDCNKALTIPKFSIEKNLVAGENLIQFTPQETGIIPYSCWMGMIKSTITVVENLGGGAAQTQYLSASPTPSVSAGAGGAAGGATAQAEPSPEAQVPQSSADPTGQPAHHDEKPTPSAEHQTAEQPSQPTASEENEAPTVAEWVEKKLTPGSEASNGKKEIRTWTGWVFDRDCVGINPVKHTLACNLMGSCIDSGLGIIEYVPGKAFDTYTAVEYHLNFDGASKELTVEFLKALPSSWKNNVTIKVTGYAVNNIPVAKDELKVPETDASKVDHYLNGIHITKIEAAYIEGLSTNALPAPNVVFTAP